MSDESLFIRFPCLEVGCFYMSSISEKHKIMHLLFSHEISEFCFDRDFIKLKYCDGKDVEMKCFIEHTF